MSAAVSALRHHLGPLRPFSARNRESAVGGQGLPLSRTMLSNHELPYVGRFACDWHRLATTDPSATHIGSLRPWSLAQMW